MTNDENSKQQQQQTNTDNINKKQQRKRSVFDLEQIRQLEHVFDQITHYPDLSLRQHLTLITQLPDKKIQIWFQNRRAKWRKQHQLGHFGGLHELTIDEHHRFVPAPKSNFILASPTPSTTITNNASIQQLEHYFYLAFQTALAKTNESFDQIFQPKRHDSSYPPWFHNDYIASTNTNN
ncbi:unnamed protein product [Adineta steineri]|uniref:Homeobox domain-containing protein n=1 Tax=Adineta steineri TaxID=433720 RepID=A0A819CNW3_9BILA|nr:unnamed protein product [Adineta steineri]CAF3821203.1 unnamed protein product [Adineta steineri]